MIKRIFWSVGLAILLLPFSASAQNNLEPPNLVEIRVEGQFLDKTDVTMAQDQAMELQGSAKPNTQVYLYISSSDPLLATVPVDKNGYWFYRLNQALDPGEHKIEGEVHEGEQISAKVELLKFNVTRAKMPVSNLILWLIFILVVIAIGFIVWLMFNKKFFRMKK